MDLIKAFTNEQLKESVPSFEIGVCPLLRDR